MLARFSPGDPVYVDRADYVVSELPRELTRRPLVAVQTAQNDKRSFSGNFLSFHLSKPAFVMVGFDSRASEPPSWLPRSGFARTSFSIPGLDDDNYCYHVYVKLYPRGVVTLGPNNGLINGANGIPKFHTSNLKPQTSNLKRANSMKCQRCK